tara:strand:+ start:835 stop:972 length:138 start_codon:yes stop_codon:yes gene_type:complete
VAHKKNKMLILLDFISFSLKKKYFYPLKGISCGQVIRAVIDSLAG